ncbi:MAG: hypothetical protein GXP62_21970, partial [Oligoflexia bacterium]|nr:hypothetical protein [Oligoflexia bacterium]
CLAAGRPAADAVLIHRAVQGSGSGVDVAASVAGGTLRFQSGQTRPAQAPLPVVVYSGRSSRTGPRIQAYRAWAQASPDHAAFLRRSAMLVPALATDPVATAREGLRILVDMAAAARFAYLTPGLVRIIALAEALNGGAKPSGAGGGDIAVAWLPDPQAQADFIAACRAEDLPPIEVHAAPGARRLGQGVLAPPSPR